MLSLQRCPVALPLVVILVALLPLSAANAEERSIRFNRDVRTILADKCFACHGPDSGTREADLRLDRREEAVENAHVIVPGDAQASELIRRIVSEDEYERMPPEESGKRLSKEEIAILRQWIDEGAEWQPHWSLVPPRAAAIPEVQRSEWVKNPIDAFILQRLDVEGLEPSPPADPHVLVRRLFFDLTGLPPTPEEVEALAADPSEEAYEALVDRLLASPHFGERLAIYWLDLVRYADTLGYHGDQERSVSPYRDYVIRAFNANLPFDQFTIENLAGDLLPDATLQQRVASTYNRLNRASGEGGVQPKEYLAKYAADRVRTTGSVWLGLTLGCAECHDHKFDDITIRDFYSFGAFFADIREQGIVNGANHIAKLPVPTDSQAQREQELEEQLDALEQQLNTPTEALSDARRQWEQQIRAGETDWQLLRPTEVESQHGATLAVQDDGSVLATGSSPDKDTYTLQVPPPAEPLTAIRLELLPDDSLPAKGPGRAGNGNLVLHRFELLIGDDPIELASATATHSQNGHDIANTLTGEGSGWAILPQVGQSHQVVYRLGSPSSPGDAPLTIRLVQNHGSKHTLGRFRLHATSAADPAPADRILSEELLALIRTEEAERSEAQQQALWEAFRDTAPELAEARAARDATRRELESLRASIITTLAVEATEPREMRVLPRGDWMDDSGEVVLPAVPEALPQPEWPERRLNRLDLAQWMVAADNPLTARTLVNRLWMLYFGNGLSNVVDDLGVQGEPPTHPELLDWMALDFRDSGWDLKRAIKQIVMSNSYRQSSRDRPELLQRDPFNRLYARQSRFRLDAELVRDQALAVSGLLVADLGGPSARPYQPAGYWDQLNFPKRTYQHDAGPPQYRRGLYTHWQRTFLHPSMLAFDASPREECTARRERSNTPLQSLVLLNDPTYVEAARVLADRIVEEAGEAPRERVVWALRQVLSRTPEEREIEVLLLVYQRHREQFENNPSAAADLLAVGLAAVPEGDHVERAAWTQVARVLLNLHETITRF